MYLKFLIWCDIIYKMYKSHISIDKGAKEMAKPVVITVDSTCDLSAELVERFNIKVIPLTVTLGDNSFKDGTQFTVLDMYKRYHEDGTLPKTSAVGYSEFLDFFTPVVENGFEIVHLDISSELSASYSNAVLASEELEGVYVVDSRMLSTGLGLLAIEGAECRDRGMSAAEIKAHLDSLTDKVNTSFVLDTLEFMRKGGRCSAVAAFGANLLSLKPGLCMSDGKLGVYKKYRGNINKVYKQYIKERLTGKEILTDHVFITNSGEIEESVLEEMKALVEELAPGKEVHTTLVGCTVATHCGPKTLGVLFINK